jgi:hypothetical protein
VCWFVEVAFMYIKNSSRTVSRYLFIPVQYGIVPIRYSIFRIKDTARYYYYDKRQEELQID